MTTTINYAPGREADLYGAGAPSVLLWHGSTPDAREVLVPLATSIAAHDLGVVVPDWSKNADDGGRADLLSSLRFTRERMTAAGTDPDSLVVVGWSLGGTAALSLVLHARRLGIAVRAAVLLAPAAEAVDPISGAYLPDPLPPGDAAVEIVHGRDDAVIDPVVSVVLGERLSAAGYDATLTSIGADHGTIAMTRHDSTLDVYVPGDGEDIQTAGESVTGIVARAASRRRR